MFKKTRVCKGLLLAFGGSLALGATGVRAQNAPVTPVTPSQLDRVEITGSSIKRIEAEGSLPVQVITRTEIDRLGVQSTEQLMQTISAMSSSGSTPNAAGVGVSINGLSSVSLRGLGDERTLVLLNGRRLAPFAGGGGATVNVNNIPLAAIERVEILKDGASAIYGSDAVAGVVNFILTKNFQGVQVQGTYGQPTASGGGEQYQANIVAGIGNLETDRYNLTGSLQYQKDEALFARNRKFASNGNVPPLYVNGATGMGNIQGAWTPGVGPDNTPGGYSRAGTSGGWGNPMAALGQCSTIKMFEAGTTSNGQPFCAYDSAPDVGLTSGIETTSGTLNFVYKLNEHTELFADGLYSQAKVTQTYQPSPARTSFFDTDSLFDTQGVDRVLLFRASNPNYKIVQDYLTSQGLTQFIGKDLGITARVFDFGPRSNTDTSTQSRLVGGIRGDVAGQDYAVGVAYNESKLKSEVGTGYFSQVGLAKATQDPTSDWNPWASTQSAAFQALVAPAKFSGETQTATSKSWAVDATISGPITKLPAGDLQYAAGYQYRNEELKTSPGAVLMAGDIAGLGGSVQPVDQGRNINSVFGELQIPIIKNLDLNLAARYDNYSDVGSTTNYKANFRWQPIPQVMIRGGYGTGFRAPTLTDLWTPQSTGTSAQFNDPVTGESDLQVTELSGGNPNLKPETSKQGSLGIVFQPMPSLSASIDYFNIKVDDVIATPSTQEVVSQNAAGNPAYAGLVDRDPTNNQITLTRAILANTGTMKAQGIDVAINYAENMGPGRLSLGLQGTYYITFDQSTPGGITSHKVGTNVNPDGSPVISSNGIDGSGVILRYKQYASATWSQGGWATTLGADYATGYGAGQDLDGNFTHMPSMTLWDLQVAYTGIKNLGLTLGARNIFDKQPTFYVPVSNQFQIGYDPTQYDPRGRFVYLTASYKFF